MNILYHGSLEIVSSPEIRKASRTLDYGSGFYLTSSEKQAEAWVRRKFKDDIMKGYVNIFQFDDTALNELKILTFDKPDEEWLDFVMSNRMNRGYSHDYDVVIGPVANDRVYASFALYEAGLIDRTELIAELKAYKLVDQILAHTEKALDCLKWIEAKEVTR